MLLKKFVNSSEDVFLYSIYCSAAISLLNGQVENSEITETTEITEKAVKQLQNKEVNTRKPFDTAWEEKTKKIKIFRDFRGFVLRPILKNENS